MNNAVHIVTINLRDICIDYSNSRMEPPCESQMSDPSSDAEVRACAEVYNLPLH